MNLKYDLIIVLGGQIINNSGEIIPAFHTESRVVATGIINNLLQNKNCYFITCGGHNVGVRYDLITNKIYDTANFAFEAFIKAKTLGPSEAEIMKKYLINNFNMDTLNIFTEELSATTTENALNVNLLLLRAGFFRGTTKKKLV